jgi:glutaredoxin
VSAKVTLYGRPGCHLCDEAEARLRAIAPQAELELINIEEDEELHARYLEVIPVICVGEEQLAQLVQYRRPSFEQALLARLYG